VTRLKTSFFAEGAGTKKFQGREKRNKNGMRRGSPAQKIKGRRLPSEVYATKKKRAGKERGKTEREKKKGGRER